MTTSSLPTVIELLARSLDIDPASITGQTELESLGADSLTVIEVIFDLEEQFGIQVGDERPDLKIVQDLADQIDRRIAAGAVAP